jgi:hypothetical protein
MLNRGGFATRSYSKLFPPINRNADLLIQQLSSK